MGAPGPGAAGAGAGAGSSAQSPAVERGATPGPSQRIRGSPSISVVVKGCVGSEGGNAFPPFSHQCKGVVTAPLQPHAPGLLSCVLWGLLLRFKGRRLPVPATTVFQPLHLGPDSHYLCPARCPVSGWLSDICISLTKPRFPRAPLPPRRAKAGPASLDASQKHGVGGR